MKRRHFLQFTGSALGAIGLSQAGFLQQASRFNRAVAQSTPRKLALLIGINNYPDSSVPTLSGCLTDIEMQYQLLVHRYGFNPSDVLKVADGEALEPTRANILQAFEEHLIAQARPGDVVVVHYSGHGSKVEDPDPITVEACGASSGDGLNGTLVPQDITPEGQTGDRIVVPDIMGRSLFLLTERIPTDNVTLVLDSCFSGAGTRGTAQARAVQSRLSRSGVPLVASEAELENQQRWLKDLGMEPDEFQRRRSLGISKGVAIGSASCDQVALELPYESGKVSGIFTYLLTSYLWQSPNAEPADTIRTNLVRSTKAAATSQKRSAQIPIFEYAPGSNYSQANLFFLAPSRSFADAVVRTTTPTASGPEIEVWFGGTAYQNLEAAAPDAIYTALGSDGAPLGSLRLSRRNGLLGTAGLVEGESFTVTEGMLLREQVLAIPDPTLRIGLHESLSEESAEAETAIRSALQRRVTAEPVTTQADVAFNLARTTEDIRQLMDEAGAVEQPPLGTLALFAPDFSEYVSESEGPVGESITAAISRLGDRLKSLLVAKVLQEMASTASNLNISGELFAEGGRGSAIPIASRGAQAAGRGFQAAIAAQAFQAGENVKIRVRNDEDTDVYLSAIAIAGSGDIVVLHPANWDAPAEAALIAPGEELVVPRQEDEVELRLSGSGFVELLTLVSRQPLNRALRGLKAIAERGGQKRGAVGLRGEELDILDSLLGDVGDVSRSAASLDLVPMAEDQTPISTDAIAVFSTVIEVVER